MHFAPPEHDPGMTAGSDPLKIHVVIADDHPVVREGLAMILATASDIELVGEANNGRQLVQLVKQFHPEVVLTDVKMPEVDGLEAIREINDISNTTSCVLLSQYDNDFLMFEAMEAGAKGYVMKNAPKNEIIEAVTTVYRQQQYFCKTSLSKLTRLISGMYNGDNKPPAKLLTAKERSIISLICEGNSNDDIGKELFMSPRTVEGYKARIMDKIGTNNTVGIVLYAIKKGLYKIP